MQRAARGHGQLHEAFVIDVYAGRFVGWRLSTFMITDFVLDTLGQALYASQPGNDGGRAQIFGYTIVYPCHNPTHVR